MVHRPSDGDPPASGNGQGAVDRIYALGAPLYRAAGWTSPLPLPPRQKEKPPEGFTGKNGAVPADGIIKQWVRERPEANICLRLPDGVIGLDFDLYKASGPATFVGLVERCGELPPTWVSTSRTDGSGIMLYRVDPGTKYVGSLGGGMEVIQHHHRYAVVWPSMHPDPGERRYRLISPDGEMVETPPRPDELPLLPERWREELSKPKPRAGTRRRRPRNGERVPDTAASSGWAPPVQDTFDTAVEEFATECRHDTATRAALVLVRFEGLGYPGAAEALDELGSSFRAAISDRATSPEAEAEWDRIVTSAEREVQATPAEAPPWVDTDGLEVDWDEEGDERGQGDEEGPAADAVWESELVLPEEFWAARPVFGRIRQAAWSRGASAEAALGAVLARLAADSDHHLDLPPIIGGPAGLSLCVALTGPPGAGKGISMSVAQALLPAERLVPECDNLPVGSGEGLAEVLFEARQEPDPANPKRQIKVRRQTRHNACVYVDEGEALARHGNRQTGTTFLPTLRSIFSRQNIGQNNASDDRKRIVPAGQYVFGVVVSIQAEKAGPIFDEATGGTPQRFLWLAANTPIPEPGDWPSWPGPIPVERPSPVPAEGDPDMWPIEGRCPVPVDPTVTEEIRRRFYDRQRHGGDALDKHLDLLREKVAALLAQLDGRLGVEPDDWRLAGIVVDTSVRVRASVLERLDRATAEAEKAATMRHARRAVVTRATLEAAEDRKVIDTARTIARKVWAGPPEGATAWTTTSMRRTLSRPQRDRLDVALDHAVGSGWVVEESEPGQGDAKRVLRPGPEQAP